MPRKNDASTPEKPVAASAGGRAIMVTDNSNDASAATAPSGQPTSAPIINRSGKTITPPSDMTEAEPATSEPKAPENAETPEATETPTAPEKAAPAEEAARSEPEITKPEPPVATKPPEESTGVSSDPEPTQAAADTDSTSKESAESPTKASEDAKAAEAAAAADARQQELEAMITNGTYFVPINAVQRKRSRLLVLTGAALLIIVALVVIDILMDMGTLSAPSVVPHTNFFTNK